MITFEEFKEAVIIVHKYHLQLQAQLITDGIIKSFNESNRDVKLIDSPISVRLLNVIKACDVAIGIDVDRNTKVSDLSNVSISALSKCRGIGKKLIKEFKDLCTFAGVTYLP